MAVDYATLKKGGFMRQNRQLQYIIDNGSQHADHI